MGHVETCGANFHPKKSIVADIHVPKMWTRDLFHQGKNSFTSAAIPAKNSRATIHKRFICLNLPDFQIIPQGIN